MIIFSVSFLEGNCYVEWFSKHGVLLSLAIDKYAYITLKLNLSWKTIFLAAARGCLKISQIKHPIVNTQPFI